MTMSGHGRALTRSCGLLMLFAVPGSQAPLAASGESRLAGYPYRDGQALYEHICQGCHMADAKGAQGAGAYPALAGDPRLAAAAYVALVILKGQKAMPSFADLSDAQIVAVTDYVRSHFGNQFAGPLTVDEVKALRPNATRKGLGQAG